MSLFFRKPTVSLTSTPQLTCDNSGRPGSVDSEGQSCTKILTSKDRFKGVKAKAETEVETEAETEVKSFDDIAATFERFKERVDLLQARCAAYESHVHELEAKSRCSSDQLQHKQQLLNQAHAEERDLRQKLQNTTADLRSSRDTVQALQNAIAGQKIAKHAKRGTALPFLQQLNAQRTSQDQKIAALEKSSQKAHDDKVYTEELLRAVQKENAELAEKVIDLALQNQALSTLARMPDSSIPGVPIQNTAYPAMPFVIALVDGDAIAWSRDLFDPRQLISHASPGSLAAHRLKSEIVQYMLKHTDQIPMTSKIVVRVICNASGFSRTFRKKVSSASRHFDFMESFTESMPLFDYYHAGTGKERVDTKIHETIHLFLHNPLCVKMFLACSTDNGFARVLEQYVHDAGARRKVCLISPGYSVKEISRLGFEEIEMPAVFARRFLHSSAAAKSKGSEVKQQQHATTGLSDWQKDIRLSKAKTAQCQSAPEKSMIAPIWTMLRSNSHDDELIHLKQTRANSVLGLWPFYDTKFYEIQRDAEDRPLLATCIDEGLD